MIKNLMYRILKQEIFILFLIKFFFSSFDNKDLNILFYPKYFNLFIFIIKYHKYVQSYSREYNHIRIIINNNFFHKNEYYEY
jgi:hypothetical protein